MTIFVGKQSSVQAGDLANNVDFMDSELSLALSKSIASSMNSVVSVIQEGDYNHAVINQASQKSSIDIGQYGKGNIAEIEQYGFDNSADISQYGENNEAHIIQIGRHNSATVVQHGQQKFSVRQVGDNESITITQY